MKKITFLGEELEAEKIIKTDESIIGKDSSGNEVFSFKGIKDFSLFKLEDGKEFDLAEKTEVEQLKEEIETLKNTINSIANTAQ